MCVCTEEDWKTAAKTIMKKLTQNRHTIIESIFGSR